MKEATVILQAPPGASGVSFDGEDYRVDGDVIEVPARAESVLRSHGYTDYVPKVKKADPAKPSKSQGATGGTSGTGNSGSI